MQRESTFLCKTKIVCLAITACLLLTSVSIYAQKQMERLNRGVVAVRTSSSQVYVGWRLFGNDPANIAFNVYRGSTKINATPITTSTNIVDNTSTNSTYTVRPVINGAEQAPSESAAVLAQNYLQIPLQIPPGGTTPTGEAYTYAANDCSVGDVDGDGAYEIIVKWDPSNAKDNAQSGYTGNVYIEAYKTTGTRLWRIDLGRNIRAGAHYTQLMVYDLDGDGRAEVAVKTADGTRDANGVVIGNASADHRNSSGYVLSGPEFLTIFNGLTGAAMATANYLPARGTVSSWGDNYGNRVDRFIAAIAYVDGTRPSLVMGRGYYTRLVRAAWDWRNGALTNRWTFDSNTSGNSGYAGQGNHQLTVGDVDNDGGQEIINGSSVIGDNGAGFWRNGLGHGDALHMSDMDPDRPGLEIWMPYESPGSNGNIGAALTDARTGARIFTVAEPSADVGRGMASDIDPRHKGYEMWASRGGLYTCKGVQITTTKPSINFAAWWDADLQRELLNSNTISKWNYSSSTSTTLFTATGCSSNNGTKSTPALSADLFGDWREEVIFKTTDSRFLRIFTTTIEASNRIYTLMHDPQYRVAIAWQNGAYNQPPHPGFYLGGGMAAPPVPNIRVVGDGPPPPPPTGTTVTIQENTTGFCSVDGVIETTNAGFTGAGYANANNAANTGINWQVSAGSAGTYTLSCRYANGGGANRPARVLVNGSVAVSSLDFPATANWTTWTEISVNVTLNAGTNSIRLDATTASGPVNIDYLVVTGNNPTAANCPGASTVRGNTSAMDRTAGNISVVPNPTNDVFKLYANGAFQYTIYDQVGQVVEKGSGNNIMTAGEKLIPGVYTIQVVQENNNQTFKVIKN